MPSVEAPLSAVQRKSLLAVEMGASKSGILARKMSQWHTYLLRKMKLVMLKQLEIAGLFVLVTASTTQSAPSAPDTITVTSSCSTCERWLSDGRRPARTVFAL